MKFIRGEMKPLGSTAVFAFALAALVGVRVNAAVVPLTDKNSVAVFDTASPAGQFDWFVDGVDQMSQQWFWFRVGNNPEQSLDSLPNTGVLATDTDFDPGNDTLLTRYTVPAFEITAQYRLAGGLPGSGTSDLAEQIEIHNLTAAPLDFHFFQYVDFDLNGTPVDSSVQFTNANTAVQTDGLAVLSESVNTTLGASSTHREVNFLPVTLAKLNDGVPTTLSDVLGPIGPGNLTWAFQWDFLIAPGSTVIISKDKLVSVPVPEPTAIGALALAAVALLRRRNAV